MASLVSRIAEVGDPQTGARYNVVYETLNGERVQARWLLPQDAMRLKEATIGQGGKVIRQNQVR